MIVSDFNAIYDVNQRVNWKLATYTQTKDFADLMEENNLISIISFGHEISWKNKGESMNIIQSKTDHMLCNEAQVDVFLDVMVHYMNLWLTDHTALQIKVSPSKDKGGVDLLNSLILQWSTRTF